MRRGAMRGRPLRSSAMRSSPMPMRRRRRRLCPMRVQLLGLLRNVLDMDRDRLGLDLLTGR